MIRGGYAVGVLAVVTVAACEPSVKPVHSTPTTTLTPESPAPAPVTVTEVLEGDAGGSTRDAAAPVAAIPGADGGGADAGPKLCGCALCDPVVSNDACATDADCAPSSPCHAPACVAKQKVPATSGVMCTQIMMCGTADANACGCVKGKCALHAREPAPAPAR